MGMGGDKLVAALADEGFEASAATTSVLPRASVRRGDRRGRPLPGALAADRGAEAPRAPVVLASSAKEEEVEHYLDLLDARELVDALDHLGRRRGDEARSRIWSPPRCAGAGPLSAVMVGDTPWDVIAATRADVKTVAVLSGGFGERELLDAGAVAVFPSVAELRDALDSTPLRLKPWPGEETSPRRRTWTVAWRPTAHPRARSCASSSSSYSRRWRSTSSTGCASRCRWIVVAGFIAVAMPAR